MENVPRAAGTASGPKRWRQTGTRIYLPGILAVINWRSRRISVSRACRTGSTTFMAASTAPSRSPGMP